MKALSVFTYAGICLVLLPGVLSGCIMDRGKVLISANNNERTEFDRNAGQGSSIMMILSSFFRTRRGGQ